MTTEHNRQYTRIARAIAYLAEGWESRPSLSQAARAAGLSPWHFQKEFRRWVGISPKQFQGALSLDHARTHLAAGAPVLEAALEAGLSGPSRLHDLALGIDAATPGEIKAGGAGVTLRHGIAETPFGRIFVVRSARGIVRLAFVTPANARGALADERHRWPHARFVRDDDAATAVAEQLFEEDAASQGGLRLAPRGTNFQIKVWQALMAIPPGAVATYKQIAKAIGSPQAARAVGAACAANPIAVLIPCHRVLRETGALSSYAFGLDRKRALIAWEDARARPPVDSRAESAVSA